MTLSSYYSCFHDGAFFVPPGRRFWSFYPYDRTGSLVICQYYVHEEFAFFIQLTCGWVGGEDERSLGFQSVGY